MAGAPRNLEAEALLGSKPLADGSGSETPAAAHLTARGVRMLRFVTWACEGELALALALQSGGIAYCLEVALSC